MREREREREIRIDEREAKYCREVFFYIAVSWSAVKRSVNLCARERINEI